MQSDHSVSSFYTRNRNGPYKEELAQWCSIIQDQHSDHFLRVQIVEKLSQSILRHQTMFSPRDKAAALECWPHMARLNPILSMDKLVLKLLKNEDWRAWNTQYCTMVILSLGQLSRGDLSPKVFQCALYPSLQRFTLLQQQERSWDTGNVCSVLRSVNHLSGGHLDRLLSKEQFSLGEVIRHLLCQIENQITRGGKQTKEQTREYSEVIEVLSFFDVSGCWHGIKHTIRRVIDAAIDAVMLHFLADNSSDEEQKKVLPSLGRLAVSGCLKGPSKTRKTTLQRALLYLAHKSLESKDCDAKDRNDALHHLGNLAKLGYLKGGSKEVLAHLQHSILQWVNDPSLPSTDEAQILWKLGDLAVGECLLKEARPALQKTITDLLTHFVIPSPEQNPQQNPNMQPCIRVLYSLNRLAAHGHLQNFPEPGQRSIRDIVCLLSDHLQSSHLDMKDCFGVISRVISSLGRTVTSARDWGPFDTLPNLSVLKFYRSVCKIVCSLSSHIPAQSPNAKESLKFLWGLGQLATVGILRGLSEEGQNSCQRSVFFLLSRIEIQKLDARGSAKLLWNLSHLVEGGVLRVSEKELFSLRESIFDLLLCIRNGNPDAWDCSKAVWSLGKCIDLFDWPKDPYEGNGAYRQILFDLLALLRDTKPSAKGCANVLMTLDYFVTNKYLDGLFEEDRNYLRDVISSLIAGLEDKDLNPKTGSRVLPSLNNLSIHNYLNNVLS